MLNALERLAKDKTARHRKLGNVIGRRCKTMLRLGCVARQLLAARENIGQLARGLLGRAHHAHSGTQRMANRPHEQREMRAAEHHGIDAVVAQRFNRGTDQRAYGRRIKDVLVLEPLLLQMCARGELVLNDLDKTRGRAAVYVDAGIQVLNGTRVSA